MLQILVGQIPEAIYFSLFMICVKQLKEKRLLFTFLMIAEYLLLKHFIAFNVWFQIAYTFITFVILKVLYKEKAQITDIFTFGIASLILIIVSVITFLLLHNNMVIASLVNRIAIFTIIYCLRKKLYKIQKLYKRLWNRNDKRKTKIKSTTFRAINVVIFNIMFYVLNLCMLYAIYLWKVGC